MYKRIIYLGTRILVLGTILLKLATPVFAGVGENERINELLYGKAVRQEKAQGYDKRVYYKTPLYAITVLYRGGIARVVSHQLQRNGDGVYSRSHNKSISIRRIAELLDKNNDAVRKSMRDISWYFDAENTTNSLISFVDAEKRTAATYDLAEDVLTIRMVEEP